MNGERVSLSEAGGVREHEQEFHVLMANLQRPTKEGGIQRLEFWKQHTDSLSDAQKRTNERERERERAHVMVGLSPL